MKKINIYAKSTIEIINTNGQLLDKISSDGNPFNVDIRHYAKGIYLIKVTGDNGMIVKSFVKE
jgi:hypothetical protein